MFLLKNKIYHGFLPRTLLELLIDLFADTYCGTLYLSLFSFHQTLSIGVSALKINNKEFTILYVGDVIVRYFLSPFLQESWRHFLLIFVIKIRVCFVITVMYFDIFETSVGIPDISTGFSRNKYGE